MWLSWIVRFEDLCIWIHVVIFNTMQWILYFVLWYYQWLVKCPCVATGQNTSVKQLSKLPKTFKKYLISFIDLFPASFPRTVVLYLNYAVYCKKTKPSSFFPPLYFHHHTSKHTCHLSLLSPRHVCKNVSKSMKWSSPTVRDDVYRVELSQ
jgi:hypothetical protein